MATVRQQRKRQNRRKPTRANPGSVPDVIAVLTVQSSTIIRLTTGLDASEWVVQSALPLICVDLTQSPTSMTVSDGFIELQFTGPLADGQRFTLASNSPQVRTRFGQYIAGLDITTGGAAAVPRPSFLAWTPSLTVDLTRVRIHATAQAGVSQFAPGAGWNNVTQANSGTSDALDGSDLIIQFPTVCLPGDVIEKTTNSESWWTSINELFEFAANPIS